jgi:pyrroloquinoline quinone biosynthesis protein E
MTERPYTLVAELTYRCPLRCTYCSNPLQADTHELETAAWRRIFAEAEELGVMQVSLTGGEPLLRDDLEEIVEAARNDELYTNLITSGIPLERDRLARLAERGLDAVQLSFQDTEAEPARRSAGGEFSERKLAAARWIRELDLPLTLNVVLHRDNIDRTDRFIALAEELGATRIELANTQYLGWALENRDALLPARDQIERARRVANEARVRLLGRMEVLFVLPDYHAGRPRDCMGGWARRFIVVAPDGVALPCHGAADLFDFESLRDRSLAEIWHGSPGFLAFRGEEWMKEPCRSCPERSRDHGGCRCQAFRLTGDARAADPACSLSPDHHLVREAARRAEDRTARAARWRRLATIP